jgi:hypothetical protein
VVNNVVEEEGIPMKRKVAVRNTEDWHENALYWCVGKGWTSNLGESTLYDTYGEAKFMADRVSGHVATIWTDR